MHQVADDIYALGSSGHNFYLIRDGDEVTMIDAGCSKEWDKLAGGLRTLGLDLEAVSGVLATHAHADHFGLAKRATDEGIDVRVHEDEETRALGTYTGRYAASPGELPMFRIHLWRTFLPIMRAGVMTLEFPDHVGTFADGDTLDLPGTPTAIHTPGHTEGHVSFHLADRGILFSGDALATMGMIERRDGPQLMPDAFHLDVDLADASLDRLVDVEADLLLPGHGSPWQGRPADAVNAARAIRGT